MTSSAMDDLVEATWRRFAPPPRHTLSAWADAHRVLAPESSAEPGRWRTSRVPYLREPMDVLADRRVETVVVMASSQVGKSEILLNLIGYHLHRDPGPILCVQPTLEMASAVSKDRIAPMLRDTPALVDLVGAPRTRDSANTIYHKAFPGGTLTLSGANSPASLASRPIRVLLADEVDRWPASAGEEGDPLALAIKRTTTFRRRKIVIVSSPTVKGASRIEDWWQISDQRRLHVPCPRCGVEFVPAWRDVRWSDRDPTTAHVVCPHCEGRIEDHERPALVAAGRWVATATSDIPGFHIWEFFTPWRSLRDQVAAFLTSRQSLEMRQAWVNTSLGELWEAPGEKVEAASLLLRREAYTSDSLPAGCEILTLGCDTHDDRLEALIVGWGIGEECWILDRVTLPGDPARPDVWRDFDALRTREFVYPEGGRTRIQVALVDAGGHRTQAVYHQVIPRQQERVFAAFGRSGGEQRLLVSPAKAIRPASGTGNVLRRIVDVDQTKALIFSRLRLTEIGPEYIHFHASLGEAFFDELTAEKLVTKRNKFGVPTKVWEQIRERNESLDCFGYALAGLRIVAPTPVRFAKLAAQARSASRLTARDAPPPASTAAPAAAAPTSTRTVRRMSHSPNLGR